MIRTNIVTLTVIPNTIAYRQKNARGGKSIVVMKLGHEQPGIAGISMKTGEPVLTDNTNPKVFPVKAFKEAIELTNGMPYRKLGRVMATADMFKETIDDDPTPVTVIDTDEYQKIIDMYTDKDGKFSYSLYNKDLIKFMNSSQVVKNMIADNTPESTIRDYVVGVKIREITKNHDLTKQEIDKISEMLDEIYDKGVYREFNEELRRNLSKAKRG